MCKIFTCRIIYKKYLTSVTQFLMHFDAKHNQCDLHVYYSKGIAVMMVHMYIPISFMAAIFCSIFICTDTKLS